MYIFTQMENIAITISYFCLYLLFHNIFDIFVKIHLTASKLFKFLLILNEEK